MSDTNVPLSVLAQSLMDADSAPDMSRSRSMSHAGHMDHKHHHSGVGLWALVFYFLLLAVFFYFVYFALRPSFVLKKDCDSYSRSYSDQEDREIDNGRLLGAAVVTALILIFVMWLLMWAVGWEW